MHTKYPTLFKQTKSNKENKNKDNERYNNWIYSLAEAKIAGTIKEIEKLSIWELCDVLQYQVKQIDKERDKLEAEKRKNKIKKRR